MCSFVEYVKLFLQQLELSVLVLLSVLESFVLLSYSIVSGAGCFDKRCWAAGRAKFAALSNSLLQ